ncbi:FtsK/SpoIIIE domain-containing protein [Streptosporangium sp. V21-05]|uniref:FtsK/SpoIIIE domain-containing protein n=1 Tax=Streptosporangium sp. V21-05 TaxID=3446115 RepID=UPI003F52EF45
MARRKKTPQLATGAQMVHVETADGAGRLGGGWLLVHGLPLVTPAIGCVVFAILIVLAHAKWGGDPVWTPLLSILFLAIGALVTFFAHLSAGPRVLLRILMVVTGSLATVSLVLGLVVGMGPIWPAYTLCSLIVWVLWVIWRGTKYAGAAPGAADGAGSPLLDAIKAAKVQFHNPTVDERGVVRAKVVTQDGGTLDGARALMPALAAHAQAVPGGTNLAADATRAGVGELEMPTRDNLAIPGGIPWPGVDATLFGALPTEPFALGEYQTDLCLVRLLGNYDEDPDAEDVAHIKIGGVTGAGKSVCARLVLGSLSIRRRLNIIGIDVSKELQTYGPVAAALTWVITDLSEARRVMKRLRKVITGRTSHLAGEGLDRWAPRSSLNLLLIWVEESSDFAALGADYEHLLGKARSAGIMVVSSLQRITYKAMSTDARANHTAGICFGVDSADDAEYVLPAPALAAIGRENLPTWGVSRRGYSYVAGMGVPPKRWSSMQRVYNPTAQQLMDTVDAGAPFRDPMDAVTAELFGELFTQRTYYTGPVWGTRTTDPAPKPALAGPASTASAPTTVPAMRSAAPQMNQESDMDEQAAEETALEREAMQEALQDSRREHLGEDARPEDLADVDPNTVISGVIVSTNDDEDDQDGDGEEAEQPAKPEMSTEEAQRVWDMALDTWYREGRTTVRTADMYELLQQVGRARRFLYRQTDRWTELECISARPDADGWDLIASPLENAGRR